jgi:hypothetical protein
MRSPASFRLPEDLLERIDQEAAERGTTATALVTTLLDEGLKTRRFPGIAYRDGPAGRRSGVIGGPDVWEIVRALKSTSGRGERKLQRLALELELPRHLLATALDFYTAFPEEIDERIAADERAGRRLRRMIERRERLLSG